jgi:Asp/Glu/Hydantoin racemase
MACNTGSVHALEAMRAEFEPDIPVVGTVPAIKPAAAAHSVVAIWATVATTASAYQRRLIAEFGGSAEITAIACPHLAEAVDAGDPEATAAAVAAAAAQTPPGCQAIVLGCTEYELAADRIAAAVPGAVTLGSAAAIAAQTLRRVGTAGRGGAGPDGAGPDGAGLDGAGLDGAGLDGGGPDGASPAGAGPVARTSPAASGGVSPDRTGPVTRTSPAAASGGVSPDWTGPVTRTSPAAASGGVSPDRTGPVARSSPAAASGGVSPDRTGRVTGRLATVVPADPPGTIGIVHVLLSGRPAGLPEAALRYPEGRLLAPLVVSADGEALPGSAGDLADAAGCGRPLGTAP